uniref:Uncharacterized protein n=1 Tax=Caenorhabditis japonica TaxID=281687 RepID=A0A8R1EQN5_CAEJA
MDGPSENVRYPSEERVPAARPRCPKHSKEYDVALSHSHMFDTESKEEEQKNLGDSATGNRGSNNTSSRFFFFFFLPLSLYQLKLIVLFIIDSSDRKRKSILIEECVDTNDRRLKEGAERSFGYHTLLSALHLLILLHHFPHRPHTKSS